MLENWVEAVGGRAGTVEASKSRRVFKKSVVEGAADGLEDGESGSGVS